MRGKTLGGGWCDGMNPLAVHTRLGGSCICSCQFRGGMWLVGRERSQVIAGAVAGLEVKGGTG
jgi:hypothetical protein